MDVNRNIWVIVMVGISLLIVSCGEKPTASKLLVLAYMKGEGNSRVFLLDKTLLELEPPQGTKNWDGETFRRFLERLKTIADANKKVPLKQIQINLSLDDSLMSISFPDPNYSYSWTIEARIVTSNLIHDQRVPKIIARYATAIPADSGNIPDKAFGNSEWRLLQESFRILAAEARVDLIAKK